jgi:hypothetical protein
MVGQTLPLEVPPDYRLNHAVDLPADGAIGTSKPFGAEVEQYRSLVSKYFAPEDVNKALYVMSYESGGNPSASGDGGHSIGLFQLHDNGVGAGMGDSRYDPEENIKAAARAVYSDGWGAWGENNLYEGQVFGALGNHPYPGDEAFAVPQDAGGGYGYPREEEDFSLGDYELPNFGLSLNSYYDEEEEEPTDFFASSPPLRKGFGGGLNIQSYSKGTGLTLGRGNGMPPNWPQLQGMSPGMIDPEIGWMVGMPLYKHLKRRPNDPPGIPNVKPVNNMPPNLPIQQPQATMPGQAQPGMAGPPVPAAPMVPQPQPQMPPQNMGMVNRA